LAQAAARTKETYLSALYGRLAARRGKQRAIMAVAHSIMVSIFHMLTRQNRITRWERATSTNDGGIIRLIDWPSGLSGSAIEYTLNR
jgi:hypothetical protein